MRPKPQPKCSSFDDYAFMPITSGNDDYPLLFQSHSRRYSNVKRRSSYVRFSMTRRTRSTRLDCAILLMRSRRSPGITVSVMPAASVQYQDFGTLGRTIRARNSVTRGKLSVLTPLTAHRATAIIIIGTERSCKPVPIRHRHRTM